MIPLHRVPPAYPRNAYKTYTVSSPVETRSEVEITCERAGCPHWERGWMTVCDETTSLGAAQADLIRSGRTGRHYNEGHAITIIEGNEPTLKWAAGRGELTAFAFPAGQKCFRPHVIVAGPEVYLVRDGDHRGGDLIRRHTRPQDWVEDFNENQQRRIEARERG